jgi:hypothetical protein
MRKRLIVILVRIFFLFIGVSLIYDSVYEIGKGRQEISCNLDRTNYCLIPDDLRKSNPSLEIFGCVSTTWNSFAWQSACNKRKDSALRFWFYNLFCLFAGGVISALTIMSSFGRVGLGGRWFRIQIDSSVNIDDSSHDS